MKSATASLLKLVLLSFSFLLVFLSFNGLCTSPQHEQQQKKIEAPEENRE